RHLDAALVANDAGELHALVLAAGALVVLGRPEDAGAEEAVPLRLEGAVVDGLGLRHLTGRPVADLLRRSQLDANRAAGPGLRVLAVRVGVCGCRGRMPERSRAGSPWRAGLPNVRSVSILAISLFLCSPGRAGPRPRHVQRLCALCVAPL